MFDTPLAVIVSVYSNFWTLLCLICAYALFRVARYDLNGESTFSHYDNVLDHTKPMEILEESDDELVVRGSERILILNRKEGTISGLHSSLTTFAKVREIIIGQIANEGIISYSVSLKLGMLSSICLGNTFSDIDASVVAAKLSTWTGKSVVA